MGLIFKAGEDVFTKNIGEQYVRIGWQQQVEKSLEDYDVKDVMNYGYIAGYKQSADTLLETALKNGFIEAQIFPIVFLYRQYLELLFKNILAKMSGIDIYKGQAHDLEQMWNHINGIFKRDNVLSKNDRKFIKEVVQEFHMVDPKSSNFRYFFKRGNILTLEDELVVDTPLLKRAIDGVDTILYGTYGV